MTIEADAKPAASSKRREDFMGTTGKHANLDKVTAAAEPSYLRAVVALEMDLRTPEAVGAQR